MDTVEQKEIIDLGNGLYGRRSADGEYTITEVYEISDTDPSIRQDKHETTSVEQARSEFFAKNDYIEHQQILDLSEIDAMEFMSWIFFRNIGDQIDVEPMEEVKSPEYQLWDKQQQQLRAGTIKKIDYSGYACWRYNPLIFYIDGKKTVKKKNGETEEVKNCKHRVVLKDDETLQPFLDDKDFALLSPITYVGRNNNYKNARYLYAFAFDLDGVWEPQIEKLFAMMLSGQIPLANLITSSGHGLHLWYLLEKPVAMYSANKELLNRMKRGLTNVIWNPITSKDEQKQYQGVIQGFRIPGTRTKFGEIIRTWHVFDSPMHTLESLNEHLSKYKLTKDELAQLGSGLPVYNPTSVTAEEAQRQWPEWYVAKVLQKRTVIKPWNVKRDVYDWWLNKLREAKYGKDSDIKLHHRYWCILTLVVYAVKCNIDREELLDDAYGLVEKMDSFSDSETNRFSTGDVDDAMKAYDENYNTWPIAEIEKTTLVAIERNKRNKRKQELHLKIARATRDIMCIEKGKDNWREGSGRKQGSVVDSSMSMAAQKVAMWRYNNPDTTNKALCSREIHTDRKTVSKWWNASLNPDIMKILEWRREHPKSGSIDECAYAVQLSKGFVRRWWLLTGKELEGKENADVQENPIQKIVPVIPVHQQEITSEKMQVYIEMSQLFVPDSKLHVEGYTLEEVRDIVTSGKWKELGWQLKYQ